LPRRPVNLNLFRPAFPDSAKPSFSVLSFVLRSQFFFTGVCFTHLRLMVILSTENCACPLVERAKLTLVPTGFFALALALATVAPDLAALKDLGDSARD